MYTKNDINKTNVQKDSPSDQNTEQTFIDETDKKILIELLTDSRMSYRQIAKKLNLAVGTVLNRIKRLEKEKAIKHYTTTIDLEKLGYDITVITEVVVSKGKLLEMEREIAKIRNVCAVYDVTGDIDAIVIAKFKNRKELSNFTKSLLSMPFIERTNSHIALTTVKENFHTLY